MKDSLALLARVLVSAYLVASSIAMVVGYNGVKFYLEINKIPRATAIAVIFIILASVSGLMLLAGYKTKIASGFFLVYLLVLNIFSPTDFQNPLAILSFSKNISIVGGILYVMISDTGKFSLDSFFNNRKTASQKNKD